MECKRSTGQHQAELGNPPLPSPNQGCPTPSSTDWNFWPWNSQKRTILPIKKNGFHVNLQGNLLGTPFNLFYTLSIDENQCFCRVVISCKAPQHGWWYGQRNQGKYCLLLKSIEVSYRQWKSMCPWKPDLPFSNDRLVHAAFHIDERKEISRGQGTRRCWHNPNSAT